MSDKKEIHGGYGFGLGKISQKKLKGVSSSKEAFDEHLLHKDLERIKNNGKSSRVLELERVYTGPNMRKERDQFRSKACSYILFKYF
ncbi:MAG: hypothetical protein EAX86_11075 [Candidatus Heimdallarchaeota archaeon]|nr:hypothetical protein [Candidatus Heimdallarchaeota archaeon]